MKVYPGPLAGILRFLLAAIERNAPGGRMTKMPKNLKATVTTKHLMLLMVISLSRMKIH